MKLRPKKIEIPKENPFKHDLLKREQYANVLTQIVENTESGFTLSINADWGYGKTTFVKMWETMLQSEGYKTIYFNAWESDFVADPMMALIDGLVNNLGNIKLSADKRKIISALVDSAIGFVELIPCLGGVAKIADSIKKGVDSYQENPTEIQKYRGIKRIVNDFHTKLSEFARVLGEEKQLIIFVDELDRCRPDYAVQMLECIKHFFSIDNIIFVLSVDKSVMCKSIQAFYGGLDIDTEAYLRRFVDVELDLPEAEVWDFVNALYNQHDFEKYLSTYENWNFQHFGGKDIAKELLSNLTFCFRESKQSLRDIEKYFNRLKLLTLVINPNNFPSELIVYILYLYMFHRNIYVKYRDLEYQTKDLWEDIKKLNKKYKYESTTGNKEPHWDGLMTLLVQYARNMKEHPDYPEKDASLYGLLEHNEISWIPKSYRTGIQNWIKQVDLVYLDPLYQNIEFIDVNFKKFSPKDIIDT